MYRICDRTQVVRICRGLWIESQVVRICRAFGIESWVVRFCRGFDLFGGQALQVAPIEQIHEFLYKVRVII